MMEETTIKPKIINKVKELTILQQLKSNETLKVYDCDGKKSSRKIGIAKWDDKLKKVKVKWEGWEETREWEIYTKNTLKHLHILLPEIEEQVRFFLTNKISSCYSISQIREKLLLVYVPEQHSEPIKLAPNNGQPINSKYTIQQKIEILRVYKDCKCDEDFTSFHDMYNNTISNSQLKRWKLQEERGEFYNCSDPAHYKSITNKTSHKRHIDAINNELSSKYPLQSNLVEVKPSNIPEANLGLFVKPKAKIPKFTKFCSYSGKVIIGAIENDKDDNNDYIINCELPETNMQQSIDASDTTSCFGRYVNSPPPGTPPNAIFVSNYKKSNLQDIIKLMTIAEIADGTEIYVLYGTAFWIDKLKHITDKSSKYYRSIEAIINNEQDYEYLNTHFALKDGGYGEDSWDDFTVSTNTSQCNNIIDTEQTHTNNNNNNNTKVRKKMKVSWDDMTADSNSLTDNLLRTTMKNTSLHYNKNNKSAPMLFSK